MAMTKRKQYTNKRKQRLALLAKREPVKTRNTRFLNRFSTRIQDSLSGRWQGVAPKSVALYNMCGDHAYERTA